jgi:hypothetical protein
MRAADAARCDADLDADIDLGVDTGSDVVVSQPRAVAGSETSTVPGVVRSPVSHRYLERRVSGVEEFGDLVYSGAESESRDGTHHTVCRVEARSAVDVRKVLGQVDGGGLAGGASGPNPADHGHHAVARRWHGGING